jgi:hypothetical protein
MSVILCSHGLLDWLNKNYSISAQLYDIINILPLVEGVMVDYHTREKISHSGKRISPETKSRIGITTIS